MNSIFSTSAASFLCIFLLASPLRASTPEHPVSGTKYTQLRRETHCDTSLTNAKVQLDPTRYTGKILELSGRVEGSSSDGNTVSLLVILRDDTSATLNVLPSMQNDLNSDPTARVRVLAEVGDPGVSNVAPLKVLAIARDAEVTALEKAVEARNEAKREADGRRNEIEARWREQASRSVEYGHRRELPPPPAAAATSSYSTYLSSRAQPLFWPYYTYIAKVNPRLDGATASKITFHLLNFADRYNVDPRLIVAMILAESHFNPNATSHSGAMGLGQLMPGTARALGVDNPYDPVQNLGGSVNYLRSRLDTFSSKALPGGELSFEQVALAMAAYNAGVNKVKKYGGIPPYTQTQNYVKRVISLYKQLCS